MIKQYTFLAVLTLASFGLKAQETHKCYAHELHKELILYPNVRAEQDNLENLTKDFVRSQESNRSAGTVYTIPVVVHIIHNGEAVGTGANVSDSMVYLQIDRLNEDFRKLNADTLPSSHPFNSLQADCEIEFCLASVDPSGNFTTGIVRRNENRASWDIASIDAIVKPKTIWNRNDYLNIWCIELIDPTAPGVDGYATFPAGSNDSTDGVVVANFAFGVDESTGGKSIVATHEMGHYFNLIHVWGDNQPSCGNDSVADTPPAFAPNSGCPTFPYSPNDSCGTDANGQMFMNYMDYSDASCTVMFSIGQKNRMLATLTSVRNSLTLSGGCSAVSSISEEKLDNDFAIFPNPSNGNFMINATSVNMEQTTISVYNSLGELVKQINEVNFPSNINCSELENGTYFVSFQSTTTNVTKKIVILK